MIVCAFNRDELEGSGLTADLTHATPVKAENIWIDLVKTTWSEER